tara:strand:+ start:510 stop:653 length:144 start_codon:yes stop_codon:yes gene_type:complete
MKTTIFILVLLLSGCAYKGDVHLYSPQGAGNIIEKAVDANVDLPILP